MCIRTYHVHNNYITYIVAMRPYFTVNFGNLDGCCVAAISRVVYHSYDFEMDTEKQRQRRCDEAGLTESGNARTKQLNTRGAYRVAITGNRVWLA